MRPLPESRIFLRSDALARGWTDPALRRAAASGRLVRLRRGVYARPHDGDLALLAAIAAPRTLPGCIVSHRSAAVLHGLPLLRPAPHRADVTVGQTGTGDAAGMLVHRASLSPAEITHIQGVRVTSVARTLVDLARSQPVTGAVVTLDAALNRGLVEPGQLDAVALRCWNWPGIGRAQRALRLMDGLAESPLESVSRLVMGWMGLPRPRAQTVIRTTAGAMVARADFYWDGAGVIGEADGRSKYDGRDVLFAEKLRQEALEDLGLVVVRWSWEDVVRRPQALRVRLTQAFERGRRRDRSSLPRLWSV